MFDENELPHELLLTPRHKMKLRNTFENNMSTDKKLSKTQIFKSWTFLGSLLSKIAEKVMEVAVSIEKLIILAPLGTV